MIQYVFCSFNCFSRYISYSGGVSEEFFYPYEARSNGTECRFNSSANNATAGARVVTSFNITQVRAWSWVDDRGAAGGPLVWPLHDLMDSGLADRVQKTRSCIICSSTARSRWRFMCVGHISDELLTNEG